MQSFHSLTIMLNVPNVREAAAFYRSIGFELQGTDEFHYGEGNINWAILNNGGATMMLSVGGDGQPKTSQQFFIRVADADAYFAAIKEKVEITHGPSDQFYGMRDFWFVDPLGFSWGAGHEIDAADGA
ncbi:MAG: VOC family protein [Pseudomonadota bacterium]